MGRTGCFVPGCISRRQKTKSKNKTKGLRNPSMFRPRNLLELEKWKQIIGRSDKEMTMKDSVCELHFDEKSILRYYEHRLKDGSIYRLVRGLPLLIPEAEPTVLLPERIVLMLEPSALMPGSELEAELPDLETKALVFDEEAPAVDEELPIIVEQETSVLEESSSISETKTDPINLISQPKFLQLTPQQKSSHLKRVHPKPLCLRPLQPKLSGLIPKVKPSGFILQAKASDLILQSKSPRLFLEQKPSSLIMQTKPSSLKLQSEPLILKMSESSERSQLANSSVQSCNMNDSSKRRRLEESFTISPVNNQDSVEFNFNCLATNIQKIVMPSTSWGTSFISENDTKYVVCVKWNACTPERRVVIDDSFNVQIFLKDREMPAAEHKMICMEDVSALLKKIDGFVLCSGVDDKSMTDCELYIERSYTSLGRPKSWCKGCHRFKSKPKEGLKKTRIKCRVCPLQYQRLLSYQRKNIRLEKKVAMLKNNLDSLKEECVHAAEDAVTKATSSLPIAQKEAIQASFCKLWLQNSKEIHIRYTSKRKHTNQQIDCNESENTVHWRT